MSRAELLELCKQRGLKATAWRKERMLTELAGLTGGDAMAAETPETPDDEKPLASSSGVAPVQEGPPLCGWCASAPTWSRSHLTCRASSRECRCACNAEDWTRPEIPAGAVPSKYNREDRELLGLPWEPRPGSQLSDAQKLAQSTSS